jgi:hypothetical protein
MPIFVDRLSARKFTTASSTALDVFVSGESNARIVVDAGGKITWGTGAATGDVTLYRSAANILKTDDAFEATLGLVNLTTAGTPSASSADGTVAVDTTNHKIFFRSGSSWRSSGVSETDADGGTAVSQVRYHVNADGGANGASA